MTLPYERLIHLQECLHFFEVSGYGQALQEVTASPAEERVVVSYAVQGRSIDQSGGGGEKYMGIQQ